MMTAFEKKIARELKSDKKDYWDKISARLPKQTDNCFEFGKAENQRPVFYRRYAPLTAGAAAVCLIVFTVIPGMLNVFKAKDKNSAADLNSLIQIRDEVLEVSDNGNNKALDDYVKVINDISQDKV